VDTGQWARATPQWAGECEAVFPHLRKIRFLWIFDKNPYKYGFLYGFSSKNGFLSFLRIFHKNPSKKRIFLFGKHGNTEWQPNIPVADTKLVKFLLISVILK